MKLFASYSILASILPLVTALPSPTTLAPRCGTTVLPSTLQSLKEDYPDTTFPNTISTGLFQISQDAVPGGSPNSKVYQLIAFTIPADSYDCELGVTFPSGSPPSTFGSQQSVVVHALTSLPPAPTFNDITQYFGVGTFGQVTLAAGQTSIVSSEACPTGGGQLAFVIEYAPENTVSSAAEFTEGAGQGFYVTYNC